MHLLTVFIYSAKRNLQIINKSISNFFPFRLLRTLTRRQRELMEEFDKEETEEMERVAAGSG
jgi:hypothetical protein